MQIGFTALKALNNGLAEFNAFMAGAREKQTSAMRFGSAVHALLSKEPFDFGEVLPAESRRPAGSSAWKKNEVEHVNSIVERARTLDFVPSGIKEGEFFYEQDGFSFRAKPDLVSKESELILDFKTSSAFPLTVDSITRDIANNLYYMQLAFYSSVIEKAEGWRPLRHVIVFLSTGKSLEESYVDARWVDLDEEWIEIGLLKTKNLLKKLFLYKERNFMENRDDFVIDSLPAPKWLRFKEEMSCQV